MECGGLLKTRATDTSALYTRPGESFGDNQYAQVLLQTETSALVIELVKLVESAL